MIRRRCKCGCGGITNYGKKYIHGHNWKNKNRSDETRKKMSLSQMGHTNNKGKKHTEETKRKIGLVHMGNTYTKGMKHTKATKRKMSKAKQNMSEETKLKMSINSMKCRTDGYCDVWSDTDYKDDLRNDICSDCGMTEKESLREWGRRLNLHHKDGNKKNCHPDNIDTLCCICHTIADWGLRKQENLYNGLGMVY